VRIDSSLRPRTFAAGLLLLTALPMGCSDDAAPASDDDEAEPVCAGKCDAIDGGMSALPVAVQSISWDGYIVVGARSASDDCRVMAVRPQHIDVSEFAVEFPPAVFSTGVDCGSVLGAHAIIPSPAVDRNPFPSDAAGNPEADGTHLTYAMSIYDASAGTTGAPQLAVREATVVVGDARTDEAEIVLFELGEAEPLATTDGAGLVGIAPSLTVDGGLLVFQGHPSNDGSGLARTDTIVYSRPVDGGWSRPRSITELVTERDTLVDGVRLGDRYALAQHGLRVPDGRTYPPGLSYFGEYPWLSRDGSELFHTTTLAGPADENGQRGRHGALAVVGRATGHTIRHVDGPLNPSREGLANTVHLRRFQTSPGQTPGFWAPYADTAPSIPLDRHGPVIPVFGTVSDGEQLIGSYNEVSFDVFADKDYLLYLPMNESLTPQWTGELFYDAAQTPDISGYRQLGRLENGAQFAVEHLGEDGDENTGAFGRAIYFTERGQVRVQRSVLDGNDPVFTVQAYVQRLVDLDNDGTDRARWLLSWPGVAELVLHEDGRVESIVIVDGQPRRSGAVGPALAQGEWTHVAFTYDAGTGSLRTYVDGELANETTFAPGRPGIASGDLLVGPAGRGEALDLPGDVAIVAIDEVGVSKVLRTADEIARAAGRRVEAPTPEYNNQALLALVDLPLGIDRDELKVPAANPPSEGAIELGRLLFFDPRLSRDGTISCATCHDPAMAWTDGNATAVGIEGRVGGRNTPTIFNRALTNNQFWDGRAPTMEDQALGPIESPMEMDNPLGAVLAWLETVPGYVERFQAVYGTGPTREAMADAISSFERAQLTGNSPVDRFEAGDETALSAAQQRGRILFQTKARCAACHSGSNFTDESFHVTGLVPQTLTDFGRAVPTGRTKDLFAYKTPPLRNLVETAPFFHDGSSPDLADVVERYNDGSLVELHDWEIRPLGLTEDEQADLVAFLEALSDPNATNGEAPQLPQLPE